MINTLFNNEHQYKPLLIKDIKARILIANDSFGALNVALQTHERDNWSDSFVSHLASKHNLEANVIDDSSINCHYIPSTEPLNGIYSLVLIKIPKTLSLLEDQLYRLKPHINNDTKIIGAGMSKHIHTSTLKLFETIIGTTTTSRATKKARLIFVENDKTTTSSSPYPTRIEDKATELTLFNHANVFSKDKLDIGTRFFIENMDKCPTAEHIIDLACGNGALGIIAQKKQANAKTSFFDESYNAIESARMNMAHAFPSENSDGSSDFYVSHSLNNYSGDKAQLILCNPPFHQVHSIGDHIAWEMFTQSRKVLEKNGELWIVGNRHLAYHIKLKKLFGNCRTIASNKKFVILAARKP